MMISFRWLLFFPYLIHLGRSVCPSLPSNALIDPTVMKKTPEGCSRQCASLLKIILNLRTTVESRHYHGPVSSFLFEKLPTVKVIAEIGTFAGGNGMTLAKTFPEASVIIVDPFAFGYDNNDGTSRRLKQFANSVGLNSSEFSETWASAILYSAAVTEKLCNYGLIHEYSVAASRLFVDNSIDFVFIDGTVCHSQLSLYSFSIPPIMTFLINIVFVFIINRASQLRGRQERCECLVCEGAIRWHYNVQRLWASPSPWSKKGS